jgi:hypothetical protein
MIKFHDYLIQYRLTPRSRILRKHLPKMAMVLEEESNMDQSSIMMSQSRMQSMSQHTSKRKRFVYQANENKDPSLPLDHDETDTDSDDSTGNGFEKDLLVFDKDQADALRFHKGGSVKSGSMQVESSMAFLGRSESPSAARRTMMEKVNFDIGNHFTTN